MDYERDLRRLLHGGSEDGGRGGERSLGVDHPTECEGRFTTED